MTMIAIGIIVFLPLGMFALILEQTTTIGERWQ